MGGGWLSKWVAVGISNGRGCRNGQRWYFKQGWFGFQTGVLSKWGQLLSSRVGCPNRHQWVFERPAVVKRVPFGLKVAGLSNGWWWGFEWALVGKGTWVGFGKGVGGDFGQ